MHGCSAELSCPCDDSTVWLRDWIIGLTSMQRSTPAVTATAAAAAADDDDDRDDGGGSACC